MKILYNHHGYPEKRNYLYLSDINNALNFKQEVDIYKFYTHLAYKYQRKININCLNSHYNPFSIRKQLRHFFNGISFNSSPWVSTFETSLPRYTSDKLIAKGIKQLASPYCKKLIALSKCTYQIQLAYLKSNHPEHYDTIKKKMIVLHPPQTLNIKKTEENKCRDYSTIVFTFVGNQFFSKGGREILSVLKEKCFENRNIELNIISNLSPDTYASNTTKKDVEVLKQEILTLPKNIIIHGSVSNQKVIELLLRSHAALLPTYADTYGYFVLEAQSCGCPVITTDIRALPEINNNDCGWIINVPKDRLGNGILKTESDRNSFRNIIEIGLKKIINEILSNPNITHLKGEKSFLRIKEMHDPQKHAKQLLAIYTEALRK